MTTKILCGPTMWMGRCAKAAGPKSKIENLKSQIARASCGDKFCEDDLTAIPMARFDQPGSVLLCEDCLAESEEAEEIYEDFNTGEALRGQLEMTLAMV